jgi:hypothetical protein
MSDFSRPSRTQSGGNSTWILIALILGSILGLLLRFISPELLDQTAIVGQVFGGLLLVVAVPLLTSQLALALNNPRDRIRRGVSHSRILVQVLITALSLLVVAAIVAAALGQYESGNPATTFLQTLNPISLVSFHSGGAGWLMLGVAILLAAILGVLGEKGQSLVTISGRIARASIRTFRLLLWAAPIGLASLVGTFGSSTDHPATASAMPIGVAALFAVAGMFTYMTIVLAIDWITGQLRPKRSDSRTFDRDRRPGQRPGAGRYQTTGRTAGAPSRPVGRPAPDLRRDRERSPFEMGVSSTPVLDIETPRSPKPASAPVSRNETESRPDSRTRPTRDTQSESDRPATDRERDGSSDSRRYPPRDRGGRHDRREGGRDRQYDRGSRDTRGDRPPRDRGPRPSRFDRRGSQPVSESTIAPEPIAKPAPTVDTSSIVDDLARVRQQLSRQTETESPGQTSEPTPPPRPVEEPLERAGSGSVQQTPAPAEMQYGRVRHRKGERHESEPHPGVEPPPMPEMVDHYSTDDMAFGRGKRKKTVK